MALGLDRRAPAHARRFLAEQICRTHLSEVSDVALLLVSEAVTNAVLHGSPPIVVAVDCDESCRLQVRVRDGSPLSPTVASSHPVAEGGRGLQLIDELSAWWGVDPEPDGKAVWFLLDPNDED